MSCCLRAWRSCGESGWRLAWTAASSFVCGIAVPLTVAMEPAGKVAVEGDVLSFTVADVARPAVTEAVRRTIRFAMQFFVFMEVVPQIKIFRRSDGEVLLAIWPY